LERKGNISPLHHQREAAMRRGFKDWMKDVTAGLSLVGLIGGVVFWASVVSPV
jgi:hypothetical protein